MPLISCATLGSHLTIWSGGWRPPHRVVAGLRTLRREGANQLLGLFPPPSAVLSQDIPHIFALTLFEDYVYWTDWETKSINRAHKTTGTNKTLLISTLHRPMDLHVFHALRQPDGEQPRGGSQPRVSLACRAPGEGYGPAGLVPAHPFFRMA